MKAIDGHSTRGSLTIIRWPGEQLSGVHDSFCTIREKRAAFAYLRADVMRDSPAETNNGHSTRGRVDLNTSSKRSLF